jgi:hypothetical protein
MSLERKSDNCGECKYWFIEYPYCECKRHAFKRGEVSTGDCKHFEKGFVNWYENYYDETDDTIKPMIREEIAPGMTMFYVPKES